MSISHSKTTQRCEDNPDKVNTDSKSNSNKKIKMKKSFFFLKTIFVSKIIEQKRHLKRIIPDVRKVVRKYISL